jgi:hypothetical protein
LGVHTHLAFNARCTTGPSNRRSPGWRHG